MMRVILTLALAILTVDCMGDENRSFREVAQIVRTCIDVQIRIGNPMIDASSGTPTDGGVNTVTVRDIPKASVYIVELGVSPSYPDAPFAMCYFDHTDKVTRALFQAPSRMPKQNDVVFRAQSMFENVSEEQANEYLLQARYTTLRLSDVLGID
jgi:hypothetical protein